MKSALLSLISALLLAGAAGWLAVDGHTGRALLCFVTAFVLSARALAMWPEADVARDHRGGGRPSSPTGRHP